MSAIPDQLLELSEAERAEAMRLMSAHSLVALNRHFPSWAHDGQLPPVPPDDGAPWRTWVLMAGRGFGKTRSGAEWVLDCVRSSAGRGGGLSVPAVALHHAAHGSPPRPGEDMRIALVAATVDEARRIMVEGESGILACAREGEIAEWAPSRRELRFANGAVATLFSGASPQALRGPQHHIAWCDELAKWRHADESWDILQLGLRCGEAPRALVTTTPSGDCSALTRIVEDPATVKTGGGTRANPHLPPAFLSAIEAA